MTRCPRAQSRRSLDESRATARCFRRAEGDTPRVCAWIAALVLTGMAMGVGASSSAAETAAPQTAAPARPFSENADVAKPSQLFDLPEGLRGGPRAWTSPRSLGSTLQVMLLLTVVSVVPAVLLMTTSFVRIVVVLGLLRQAIGAQQSPPNQVITALAMFMTLLIMTPVWKQVYDRAVAPYTQEEIGLESAWTEGVAPIRRFMSMQIERTGNSDDVWLLLSHLPGAKSPSSYEEVPLTVLLPAYLLSELKTAFLIGFQVFLPFLVVDVVVATVLSAMGMMMVPPGMVSLPMKLLLFVLLDGWRLVVGMLLESFQPFV